MREGIPLSMARKLSWFDLIVGALLVVLCFVMIYPFLYALAYSLSDGVAVMTEHVTLLPVGFTWDNYHAVFLNNDIFHASQISVARTLAGTTYSTLIIGMAAYSMSKPQLVWRRTLNVLFIIVMYVGGGLIPYYVVIHDLGLMNHFLVYILPGAFGTFLMLLMRVYFEGIPESMEESAKLEGANDFTIFWRIYFPLSLPTFATVALFVGVGQWNSWFDASLFVSNPKLAPLQLLLQQVLQQATVSNFEQLMQMANGQRKISVETLRMAVLIVTVVPIVFAYPFFQRFFIKSVMLGAVKG